MDGSAASERAARHAAALKAAGLAFEVLLLDVQPERVRPRSREEKRKGLLANLEAFERTLRPAEERLARAGVPFRSTLRVGTAADHRTGRRSSARPRRGRHGA
ncbi:MAG: hypothetical protein IT529_06970 [Burkholderiales bacterium]|nr:hypothetical protein [Burkholderiales bacterium]